MTKPRRGVAVAAAERVLTHESALMSGLVASPQRAADCQPTYYIEAAATVVKITVHVSHTLSTRLGSRSVSASFIPPHLTLEVAPLSKIPFIRVIRRPLTFRRSLALQPTPVRFPYATHIMSTLKRKADVSAGENEAKKPKANGNIASFFGAATPKPATKTSASAPGAPAVKFDKEKWVATLTPEQKELLQLEIDTMDESWLAQLKDDITTTEFLNLKKFLKQETANKRKWFPPAEDVYSW